MTTDDVPCTVEKKRGNTIQHTNTRDITTDGCNGEVMGSGFLNNQACPFFTTLQAVYPSLTTSSFFGEYHPGKKGV